MQQRPRGLRNRSLLRDPLSAPDAGRHGLGAEGLCAAAAPEQRPAPQRHGQRPAVSAGPGRALILRLMSVPPMVSDMLATTIYPFLCVTFGWQAFPYVHGVLTASFLVLWKLFVQDKPPLSPEEKALADAAKAKQAAEAKAKTIEWRIFTLPCVLSCMWAKFGSGVLSYALETWGEIFI